MKKFKFRKILILLVFIAVFGIAFLEIGSKFFICSFETCHTSPYNTILPTLKLNPQYATIEKEDEMMAELRRKRLEKVSISKMEYEQAFEKHILEVDPKHLCGAGGKAGMGYNVGFVSNSIPKFGIKHVKRHELEHLLGGWEGDAYRVAFLEYPLEGISNILRSSGQRYFKKPCLLFSDWKLFKKYILQI